MGNYGDNLSRKARSAAVWSSVDTVFREGIGFCITVALARLLLPEDFGTIALLALFLGIANSFVNAGFAVTLIQMQHASMLDESTIFWFNLSMALLMALVLWAAAPSIAEYFHLEVLSPLTKLMAVNVVISSLGTIHSTLLTKRLEFRIPMRVGAVATVSSGALGIYLAFNDFGVWALAWQAVASTFVSTSLLWYFSSWRPVYRFSGESFVRMFSFGGWVFASSMLDEIYQKGYTLLIGKAYGTYELGIYRQADNTQLFPAKIMTGVLSRVSFPLFSSVSQDKLRLKRWVRLAVRSIMLICAPTMVGLAVLANPIIELVFGARWLSAVPILQVLCFIGLLWPLHVINVNVLLAQGHSKLDFRLAIIKKSTGVVFLVVGSFFGIMGIAWSRVIHSFLALAINGHYSERMLDYGIFEQVRDCLSSLLLSILMGVVVILCDRSLEVGGFGELGVLIVIGASFYLATNFLFGVSAFKEAYRFVRDRSSGY